MGILTTEKEHPINDNLTRYFAIQKALKSLRPTEPKGNVARHLNTLAMMIAGILGSQKSHLPAIAKKAPLGESLSQIGLTRKVDWAFSKRFREKYTQQGFQEKLTGIILPG